MQNLHVREFEWDPNLGQRYFEKIPQCQLILARKYDGLISLHGAFLTHLEKVWQCHYFHEQHLNLELLGWVDVFY